MPYGKKVSRTTPDVVQTATMLIRFCVAIDLIDVAGAEPVVDFLRLAFYDVALPAIAFPEKVVGQARLRYLTLTRSLSRLCPRSAATMSWVRP